MTPDQERRLRESAFDTDINDILEYGRPVGRTEINALVDCLTDIRDILHEPVPQHDPWDSHCSRNGYGEPWREDAICPACRPTAFAGGRNHA